MHICALYDVGRQDGIEFLVMEYLQGDTLEERLKTGALPIDQALRYAIEIADALDRAHRAGIVHRDLKPGNIFLTKSGAKLLDFGLAKTDVTTGPVAGLSMLPTTPPNLTAQGAILGTFQYMAPEQLEGNDADARTDIFAFAAVLYEMMSGKKAFKGKSQATLIAAIMSGAPGPISTVQPLVPPSLDRIVATCLEKDPDSRWQNAGDLARELRWIQHGDPASGVSGTVSDKASRLWKIATPLIAATTLIGFGAGYLLRTPIPPQESRFVVQAPTRAGFLTGGRAAASAVISPDGRMLAFTAADASGKALLWLRPLDALGAHALSGTEDAAPPFWSPDGRYIAYFAHDKLLKIDAAGGPPQTICAVTSGRGGAWGAGMIVLWFAGRDPRSRAGRRWKAGCHC